MKVLRSPWVSSGIGLLLYVATTAACWYQRATPPIGHTPSTPAKAGPSWTYQNPEIDQLVAELKREKQAIADKEKLLNDFSARLQAERQELNQLTQSIHVLQNEFDRSVVQIEEQESVNLKKLAKVYAGMAPENAIHILRQMEETTLVKVFASMKDSERGPVLEALANAGEADAKLAATISERLRLAVVKGATPNAAR